MVCNMLTHRCHGSSGVLRRRVAGLLEGQVLFQLITYTRKQTVSVLGDWLLLKAQRGEHV
jgi:hypothetical protein